MIRFSILLNANPKFFFSPLGETSKPFSPLTYKKCWLQCLTIQRRTFWALGLLLINYRLMGLLRFCYCQGTTHVTNNNRCLWYSFLLTLPSKLITVRATRDPVKHGLLLKVFITPSVTFRSNMTMEGKRAPNHSGNWKVYELKRFKWFTFSVPKVIKDTVFLISLSGHIAKTEVGPKPLQYTLPLKSKGRRLRGNG